MQNNPGENISTGKQKLILKSENQNVELLFLDYDKI